MQVPLREIIDRTDKIELAVFGDVVKSGQSSFQIANRLELMINLNNEFQKQ